MQERAVWKGVQPLSPGQNSPSYLGCSSESNLPPHHAILAAALTMSLIPLFLTPCFIICPDHWTESICQLGSGSMGWCSVLMLCPAFRRPGGGRDG